MSGHQDEGDEYVDEIARKLHGTTDAMVWAEEYARIFPNGTGDVGTMVGWFANAIEVGRDAGRGDAGHQDETAEAQARRIIVDPATLSPEQRERIAEHGARLAQQKAQER